MEKAEEEAEEEEREGRRKERKLRQDTRELGEGGSTEERVKGGDNSPVEVIIGVSLGTYHLYLSQGIQVTREGGTREL